MKKAAAPIPIAKETVSGSAKVTAFPFATPIIRTVPLSLPKVATSSTFKQMGAPLSSSQL